MTDAPVTDTPTEETVPTTAPEETPVVDPTQETGQEDGESSTSTDGEVEPAATPDVTPTASETPEPAVATPASEVPPPLIPAGLTDFHDSREVAHAEALGLPTSAGLPLSAAARETIRGLEESLQGIESWVAYIRRTIGKMPQ